MTKRSTRARKMNVNLVIKQTGYNHGDKQFWACARTMKLGKSMMTKERHSATCGYASSPRKAVGQALKKLGTKLEGGRVGHKRYGGR
jgi:hypothetical protein